MFNNYLFITNYRHDHSSAVTTRKPSPALRLSLFIGHYWCSNFSSDSREPTCGYCKVWLAIVSEKAKKSYVRFLLLKWLLGVFIPLLFLFICRVVGCSVISFTRYLSLSLTCFATRSRGF